MTALAFLRDIARALRAGLREARTEFKRRRWQRRFSAGIQTPF